MTERSWPARCRDRLLPALEAVRLALDRYIEEPSDAGPVESLILDPPAPSSRAALDLLVDAFELNPFETAVLLLCAGVELDSRIAGACAQVHGDPRRRHASFGLALAALPGAHFSATAPISTLRRWRLVSFGPGEGLADRPLRICERVLHYLGGVSYVDAAFDGVIRRCDGQARLSASQRQTAEQVAAITRTEAERGRRPLIHLVGSGRADRIAVASAACVELGLDLHIIRGDDLPSDAVQREELAQTWAREAVLARSALLVEAESNAPAVRAAISGFVEIAGGVLILAGGESPELHSRGLVTVDVQLPSASEQRVLWADALPGVLEGRAIERLVAQFSLSPDAIADLAAQARAAAPDDVPAFVWAAARRRARPALGALARSIEPRASWDLLVLPESQRATLRDVEVQVRHRQQVYESWGFATHSSRGLGISALFAGPSGTGKTMAAEVLARALDLDLVHIDLSSVVSKYIGETEKNLSRIFDAADRGGAILLFDEADALFGRRSEVKDSHDRYANIEVSYLLQRMEAYRGLAILTTNLETSLDPAFMRRIRFVVRFPIPEPEQRAEIWRRIFPPETPTDGLDAERLGRLAVPGGNIRNIALHAAFLAAEADSPVTMRHLADAARNELRKIGRTAAERELRHWE